VETVVIPKDMRGLTEIWKCEYCGEGYEYYMGDGVKMDLPICDCKKPTVILKWIDGGVLIIGGEEPE